MNQVIDITDHCRRHFKNDFTSIKDAADHYECSVAFISSIQTGMKPPTKKMQQAMGLVAARVVIYFKIEDVA